MCGRGLDGCDDHSATKQFQQWVGLLTDDDRPNLRRLGLDPGALRKAAADGHVYGFVVNWMTKKDLLGLLAKPAVRDIRVVEAVPRPSGRRSAGNRQARRSPAGGAAGGQLEYDRILRSERVPHRRVV
ncbi:hypothetical protein AAH991_23910 [Microbispora sp. ZYX-F-249]|uniref:Extradiol ring-cleavage dioxygenase LigAB LigA subunit domain-containing protein n=1 Tax=Microbispora maris TaxID=3144104 RepID=A0ABV0AV47_9ACTN